MKYYAVLALLGYMAALLIPLPLLPKTTTWEPSAPLTSPLNKDEEDKPRETVVILDAAAGVLYTFDERDFLIYTVAAEMPASYHPEALKAQAVATYTYYQREKLKNAGDASLQGAHSSQVPSSFPSLYSPEGLKSVWGDNYDTHLQTVAAAVDSVLGQTLTYENEPICAVYHASCGGRTETAGVVWGNDYPYLQSVVSAADAAQGGETQTVSEADFAAAFADLSLSGDAGGWITGEAAYSAAGSVTALTVGGKVLTGQEIRKALNLRSAYFSVKYENGAFVFDVRGHGHGVGMSQVGANAMAQQGFSYRDILAHYYTGVTLEGLQS